MITASFSHIRKRIQTNIDQSKETIKISVAWFTSKALLGQLNEKLESGCNIEIIISDHIENKRLSFDNLIAKGGRVFVLKTISSKFLHDKFAIFDNSQLIAGSYNWTNSAEFYNHEFVIQSSENQLIKQFNIRFENLKKIVTNYDKSLLLSRENLTAETKEEEFINLENELELKFLQTIKEANELGAKINSTSVIEYIRNYGAIEGVSRLINVGTNEFQSGLLKLWEINRLNISFESIILQDKFRVLFDYDILEKARKRLSKLNQK